MISSTSMYPTIRLSSAMLNTFGRSLNISQIFCCNMSAAGDTSNVGLVNVYLPNIHANMVNIKISYLVLVCGNPSLHQLWSYIIWVSWVL